MMREDDDSEDSSNSTFDSDETDSIAESLLSADLFIMQASFYCELYIIMDIVSITLTLFQSNCITYSHY